MLTLSLESATETIDLNELLNTSAGAQAIAGLTGLGLPPVDVQWSQGAGDGAKYRGRRVLPRDIDLPLYFGVASRTALKAQVAKLSRVLSDEATLRLTDETGVWTATVVRVGGGDIVYGEDTNGERDMATVVTLRAGQPFWTSTSSTTTQQTSTGIGSSITLTNDGTADAYPIWEITGPGQDFTITSPKGEVLSIPGKLANGQYLKIDTAEGTVVDASGVSQYGLLGSAPKFFPLRPGANVVGLNFPTYSPTLLRTNLFKNPNFAANITGADTSGGGWTNTWGSGAGWSGNGYLNAVFANPGSYIQSGFYLNPALDMAVVGNATYTLSLYGKRTTSNSGRQFLTIYWYDSAGNSVGTTAAPATVALPVGTWARLSVTGTAPANAAFARAMFSTKKETTETVVSNNTFNLDAILFEKTSTVQDYFDGSFPDPTGFDYAWTGTANASTSTYSTTSVNRSLAIVKATFKARDWMVI